jgi:hypothetical protein
MSAPRHPDETRLALLAGGELGWIEQLRAWGHVRGCAQCRNSVHHYRRLRQELARDGSVLPVAEEDWSRMEAEMAANIRLGLAAGSIVDEPGPGERSAAEDDSSPAPFEPATWRAAVVLATLAVVMVSSWWLRREEPQPGLASRAPALERVVLEAGPNSLAVESESSVLTLLGPSGEAGVTLVDAGGGARTRYIDAETGQVTIHHVSLDE